MVGTEGERGKEGGKGKEKEMLGSSNGGWVQREKEGGKKTKRKRCY